MNCENSQSKILKDIAINKQYSVSPFHAYYFKNFVNRICINILVLSQLFHIFEAIILCFIFCHFPRVALDVHEISTLAHSNFCAKHKMPNTFPAWSFIAIYVSHFCLVINATLNMIIYCFMCLKFREEGHLTVKRIWCSFHQRN